MPDHFKFLAYSDIHYDRLAAKCITLDDCLKIEKEIQDKLQVEDSPYWFSIFGGDRFLRREPEDEIKTRADNE